MKDITAQNLYAGLKKILDIKSSGFWLLAALTFGIVTRIFYAHCYANNIIFYNSPVGEGRAYLDISRSLIYFDLFDKKFLFYSPVYSLFVAACRFFIGNFQNAYLTQSLLGILNIYLAYSVTKGLFEKKIGAVAAWIYALTPVFMFYELKLSPLTLGITSTLLLCLLFITIVKSDDFISWGLFGLFSAILCNLYTRYTWVLLMGVLLILIFNRKFFVTKLTRLAFSLISFMVIYSPILVWNQMITDEFTSVKYGYGFSFFINNRLPGEKTYFGNGTINEYYNSYERILKTAEEETETIFESHDLDSFYFNKRTKLIAAEPWAYLKFFALKGLSLFSLKERTAEYSFNHESKTCPLFHIIFFPPVIALILGGIFLFGRNPGFKLRSFFLLLFAVSSLSFLAFDNLAGERALVLTPVLPFAACGLFRLSDGLRKSMRRIEKKISKSGKSR